jgi:hypothetical protein
VAGENSPSIIVKTAKRGTGHSIKRSAASEEDEEVVGGCDGESRGDANRK